MSEAGEERRGAGDEGDRGDRGGEAAERGEERGEPRRGGGDGEAGSGCFNCGKQGHLSRDCPEPRKPRDTSDATCYLCEWRSARALGAGGARSNLVRMMSLCLSACPALP